MTLPTTDSRQLNGAQAVSGPSTEENPEDIFDLSDDPEMVKFAKEAAFRRREKLDHEKWLEEYGRMLARKANGRTDIRLNGVKIFSQKRDGIFSPKKFKAEQPVLTEQFTEYVTELKLNAQKLKAENPDMYKKYQALTLHWLDGSKNL